MTRSDKIRDWIDQKCFVIESALRTMDPDDTSYDLRREARYNTLAELLVELRETFFPEIGRDHVHKVLRGRRNAKKNTDKSKVSKKETRV